MALSSGPADPVPELRVAAGVLTTLVFDAPLDRGSVELEGRERFRLVDAGDRSIMLEPAADLGPGERLGLRVRYAGSGAQDHAGFTLATHASEVDTRVEVFRRNDSVDLLRAELMDVRAQLKVQMEENQKLRELRDTSLPVGLIMSGMLDHQIRIRRIKGAVEQANKESLKVESATSFLAPTWAAIIVVVRNNSKRPLIGKATSAFVKHARTGAGLDVVNIYFSSPIIAPGEAGSIVVEVKVPSWRSGEACRLELHDNDGITQVTVSDIVF